MVEFLLCGVNLWDEVKDWLDKFGGGLFGGSSSGCVLYG